MNTPAGILEAFAPTEPLTLTMEGILLLEAESPAFLTGGTPTHRDLLIAALVLADPAACSAARRSGKFDDYLADQARSMTPRELLSLSPKIMAALSAAFAPLEGTATDDGEKKPDPAAAGG